MRNILERGDDCTEIKVQLDELSGTWLEALCTNAVKLMRAVGLDTLVVCDNPSNSSSCDDRVSRLMIERKWKVHNF